MSFQNLKKRLLADTKPVKPYKRFSRSFFLTLLALVLFVSGLMQNTDYSWRGNVFDWVFLLTVVSLIVSTISALIGAFRLSRPCEIQKKDFLFIFPLLMWLISLLIPAGEEIKQWGLLAFLREPGMGCFKEIAAISIVPFLLLGLILRRGVTTHPLLLASIVSFFSVSIGTMAVSFLCHAHSFMHILLWHSIPLAVLGFIGTAIMFRLFKW